MRGLYTVFYSFTVHPRAINTTEVTTWASSLLLLYIEDATIEVRLYVYMKNESLSFYIVISYIYTLYFSVDRCTVLTGALIWHDTIIYHLLLLT